MQETSLLGENNPNKSGLLRQGVVWVINESLLNDNDLSDENETYPESYHQVPSPLQNHHNLLCILELSHCIPLN